MKKSIFKLALIGLLTASLVAPVYSTFVYSNLQAADKTISNNNFEIGDGFITDKPYENDFSKNEEGKTNKEILDVIFGGTNNNGIISSNGLLAKDSLINNELSTPNVERYDYYITSEDYLNYNGKQVSYREYYGLPNEVKFVIERRTSVIDSIINQAQEYYIYTTTVNISSEAKVISPVYRTKLSWTPDPNNSNFGKYGKYVIEASQEGRANFTYTNARINDNYSSNIIKKGIPFFDFKSFNKPGDSEANAISLNVTKTNTTVKVDAMNQAWYKVNLTRNKLVDVKANPGIIITVYEMVDGSLEEVGKINNYPFETNHKVFGTNYRTKSKTFYLKIEGASNQSFDIKRIK